MKTEPLVFDGIWLRPPRPEEFSFLTLLRNRERRWFGDQRQLEDAAAAAWMAARNDDDQLLCIESELGVLGTIGWARIPTAGRFYELGRAIADYRRVRRSASERAQLRRAVQIAGYLATEHLFGALQADAVYARNRPENRVVRRSILGFEGQAGPWPFSSSADGLECWHVDAADWPEVRDRILGRLGAGMDSGGERAEPKQ